MLYATKGKVNDAIKRFDWDYATVELYGQGGELRFPFVQSGETQTGLLISFGHDDYLPSSTLRHIEGEIEIDDSKQQIAIKQDGKLKARVVEATWEERHRLIHYHTGQETPDELEQIKRHIEEFRVQLRETRRTL